MPKFKLPQASTILLILTVLQFIYTVLLGTGTYTTKHFSLEHEDTIFIIHLMTYFIVSTIERVSVNLNLTLVKGDKDEK